MSEIYINVLFAVPWKIQFYDVKWAAHILGDPPMF
jgi:hypothetical protein